MLQRFLRFVATFCVFSCCAGVHSPDAILSSTPPAQNSVNGLFYNLDNFIQIAEYLGLSLDQYGANSTVDYQVPVFPGITTFANALPQLQMSKNDYILIEVAVPDSEWLNTHSLFNITPYFYFYDGTTVYASENITIQFFEKFKSPHQVIKICMTANKDIGNAYSKMGYIISAIPEEYLNSATFQILARTGTVNGTSQTSINRFATVKFYQGTQDPIANAQYYTANEIIASFPAALFPEQTMEYINNITDYDAIVSYLMMQGYTAYQLLDYLSNINSTDYAFDNFYKAITVSPPAQLQANNTGENYFNSQGVPVYSDEFIDLTTISSAYIYVLSINQNEMGSGLTSNVQVYNSDDLALIDGGLIITSPDLPAFSAPDYPYVSENTYPLFQINAYSVSDLIMNGITSIIIAERISYNPVNFYQTSYEYPGKAYFFFGDTLTSDQSTYLLTNYGITVNYN